MVLLNVVERTPLLAAVEQRLAGLNQVPLFLGRAGDVPTVEGDPLGRAAPYLVLHPWLGNVSTEQNLAETTVDLEWGFQLTVASGFVRDTMAVVGDADALLHRWVLELPDEFDAVAGMLTPPPGYQPMLLTDSDVSPHRFYVPLQYGTTITRS